MLRCARLLLALLAFGCGSSEHEPASEGCPSGQIDCGDDAGCVDTRSDPDHCGACGLACPAVPFALPGCADGVCGIGTCHPNYASCDGDEANGCETYTYTDVHNCGACGHDCRADDPASSCESGVCAAL